MSNHRDYYPEEADEIRYRLEVVGFEVIEMLFDVPNPNRDFNWAYINYLQVGNKIIVPTFGIDEDKQALKYIRDANPGCVVRGFRMRDIAKNGGALQQTINVINNIVLKDGILHAYGREGNVTRVFLRQGNLEGRCAVYSLMMLLILHGILNREDLLRKVSAKAPEYIKKLKRQFNYSTTRGYSLKELRIKLLRSFNNKIPMHK